MQPEQVAVVLANTLAPNKDVIRKSEDVLKGLAAQPGYGAVLLQVAASQQDLAVRQAAAVSFKNLVKFQWIVPEEGQGNGLPVLGGEEKAYIKTQLLPLMLTAPSQVQSQLGEALSLICGHDFPAAWPQLLPDLMQQLQSTDLTTLSGVLSTAQNVFKRYSDQLKSDDLVAELVQTQDVIAAPLLSTMQRLYAQLPLAPDAASQSLIITSLRSGCRIFRSLNAPGLTPTMEGQLEAWMTLLHSWLVLPSAAGPSGVPGSALAAGLQPAAGDEEGLVDSLRRGVCDVINLFMQEMEEDFERFLPSFVSDVWAMLTQLTLTQGQDRLAISAMSFLTSICKSMHHTLFGAQNALEQICQSVVLPNLRVRQDDQELFEMNPVDYIRRDVEGGDTDSRRRAASDLVRSLLDRQPVQVTALCTTYLQALLAEYAAAPSTAWQSKDCALCLVLAVAVRGKTATHGATTVNSLVDLQEFFTSQVLPELQSPKVDALPILKADALKFITTFRSQLPTASIVGLLPSLITLLGSSHCVVHSYAALAIEKLLMLKVGGVPRLTPADVAPHLGTLLTQLFSGFKQPDSGENEYLMRAVTRVLGFMGPGILPVAQAALQELARMLMEVCSNPRHPGFNHALFESVAALIQQAGTHHPASIPAFEQMLFPAVNLVLQQDVQEFHPYVFQILSQINELRDGPMPAVYMQMLPPLLLPMFWERAGNIPPLVRLMQAYLNKAGTDIVAGGHLLGLLGVFQKLISSKAHDHEGFALLNSIVESLPLASYQPHLPTVFTLSFQRLQNSRTSKFVRGFLIFLSTLIMKHGPGTAQTILDTVQPGILLMLLQQVWLPALPGLSVSIPEDKLVLVATAKCLGELPPLQAQPTLWSSLRDATYKQLADQPAPEAAPQQEDEVDGEPQVYTAAYARLVHAGRPQRAVLSEIPDPRQYLDASVARLASAR